MISVFIVAAVILPLIYLGDIAHLEKPIYLFHLFFTIAYAFPIVGLVHSYFHVQSQDISCITTYMGCLITFGAMCVKVTLVYSYVGILNKD